VENENKRLAKWFGTHWHEWDDGLLCHECGSIKADRHCIPNPDYSTESGFFALLNGLRSKGFNLSIENDADVWWVHIPDGENCKHGKTYSASGDTLPLALFNAAIKAMDAETSGEGTE